MIRLLNPSHIAVWADHMRIHNDESGTDGELPYGPYNREDGFDPTSLMDREAERWHLAVTEPGWRRVWGLFTGPHVGSPHQHGVHGIGRMVGHCTLAGGDLVTQLHRCRMGLGVQRPFRRQGHGRALVDAAMGWAATEATIDWVDLGVFQGNDVAQRMYEQLGFEVIGRTRDLFRVDGRSIGSVAMTRHVPSRGCGG